ncbi:MULTISPECIES: hypothetical protein [Actinosynnema]|uniref:hypothetical protein n=1 Tax=Actinosynnema TaxID=40566 RepID=UPI0020A610D4|nr:hypothetical protein [Actinosynnema pretiosum]
MDSNVEKKLQLALAALGALCVVGIVLLFVQAPPVVFLALLVVGLVLGGYAVRLEKRYFTTRGVRHETGARGFLPTSGKEALTLGILLLGFAAPILVDGSRLGWAEALSPVRLLLWLVGGYTLWFVTTRSARLRRAARAQIR